MKKMVIISVLVLIPFLTEAQFSKGQVFLGNTISFSTTQAPNDYGGASNVANTFSIGPVLGIFIGDKWALGLPVSFSTSYSENKFPPPTVTPGLIPVKLTLTTNVWSVGLLMRRYLTLSEKVFVVIEGKASYSKTSPSGELTLSDGSVGNLVASDSHAVGLNIRPLLAVFPSPSWSIEGGFSTIEFTHSENVGSTQCQNAFNFSLGTVSLGASYFFARK